MKILLPTPDPKAICECGDCHWRGRGSKIAELNIEEERFDSDDINILAGECPECGALAWIAGTDSLERFIVVGVNEDEGKFFVDRIAAIDEEDAEALVREIRSCTGDCEAWCLEHWRDVALDAERKSIDEILAEMAELAGEEAPDATTES